MDNHKSILFPLALITITVYFFVVAPVQVESATEQSYKIPIQKVLEIAEQQYLIVQEMQLLKSQVNRGQGLASEMLHHPTATNVATNVGAQYFRTAASMISIQRPQLRIQLGSDFPINTNNRIADEYAYAYQKLKQSKTPQFYYSPLSNRYAYLSADVAESRRCVQCHNRYHAGGKSDWNMNEVMGATIWSYTKEYVSLAECHQILMDVQQAFGEAYGAYLSTLVDTGHTPEITDQWPAAENTMASVEAFRDELERRSAPLILRSIREIVQGT